MNWLKKLYKKLEPRPLEKTITGIAYPIPADKLRNLMIVEINDKIYREQKSPDRKFSWIFLGVVFLLLTPLAYVTFYGEESFSIRIVFSFFWIGSSLTAGFYPLYAPYEELVLNRETGMVSFPRYWPRKKLDIQFDDMDGYIIARGDESSLAFALEFAKKDNPSSGGEITDLFLDEFWDFVVWYMDKNRPLPPGTAFDPYREADYQRRKAEGFTKPLYYSYLETPEATPEQQAERKRIGKW